MTEDRSNLKIIVLDDDPTGSQTVHGCPLLLRWDPDTLRRALAEPSPLLFLLANTRALAPEAAAERVRQIAAALRPALAEARASGVIEDWLLVSRGDSTLRGHCPLEAGILEAELGPFAATVLVPAFLEGGRTTVDAVHRLDGVPVHETPFARDGQFAYSSSHLPTWLEQRSAGRLAAAEVAHLPLALLQGAVESPAGADALRQRLEAVEPGRWLVVDAERPAQLAAFARVVRQLGLEGRRRFLFQSAASLLTALAALPPQPRDAAGLAALRRRDRQGRPLPGLVLVGSHVPLADRQLERLLAERTCIGVELPVQAWQEALEGEESGGPGAGVLSGRAQEALRRREQELLQRLRQILETGATPVLHTSRGERWHGEGERRRRLGEALAASMARLAAALSPGLGYLISKGGITSQTLLADGLGLARVQLQGQLLPGLSLVLPPPDGAVPPLPLLTFPGNLGEAGTLRQAWCWMEAAGELP